VTDRSHRVYPVERAGTFEIIVRGIERRKIFWDDVDRDSFIDRLGQVLAETHTDCFAWALIPNHVHLLLRSGLTPISTVMRRLLTGYAVQFNRRHRRHGHLFQNRYKSILFQEDPYLTELVRYIHLNPILMPPMFLIGSAIINLKFLSILILQVWLGL
jgi:putative transposase